MVLDCYVKSLPGLPYIEGCHDIRWQVLDCLGHEPRLLDVALVHLVMVEHSLDGLGLARADGFDEYDGQDVADGALLKNAVAEEQLDDFPMAKVGGIHKVLRVE